MARRTEKADFEHHPPIGEHDPVPRVPKARGFGLSRGEIGRIAIFGSLLFGVLMLREPCAKGVGGFVDSFEEPSDAAPRAQTVAPPGNYVHLGPDDSPDDIKRKIEGLRDAGSAAEPKPAP
ncbi:MAG TPA: hypothetical protein VML75_12015 [Kofleriaceae bacterium]|nr:hypothetical protein [Kofleriaceae bacterium]